MFDGLAEAVSLRSVQGMGTDEMLNEMVAKVVSETNTRKIGG